MKLKATLLAAALAAFTLLAPGASAARGSRGPSYPMKADEFRKLADRRIEGVLATIEKKLDRHGVSKDRKKEIRRVFEEASRDARAEIAKAAADGTVTEAEAGKVKALTKIGRAHV